MSKMSNMWKQYHLLRSARRSTVLFPFLSCDDEVSKKMIKTNKQTNQKRSWYQIEWCCLVTVGIYMYTVQIHALPLSSQTVPLYL